MFEAELRIDCKDPNNVRDALVPDAENSEDVETEIKSEKGLLRIIVKARKLSHLKAIINSYLSLVSMIIEAEKLAN